LKAFLRKFEETEFDLIHVTGFALFSSVLTQEGAQHALELRVKF
jgi:2'-5' RNA ligase